MNPAVKDIDRELFSIYSQICNPNAAQKEREIALQLLASTADSGNAEAMMLRGLISMQGAPDVLPDDGVTFEYMKRATDGGDIRAPQYLSHIYAKHGDSRKAFDLMQRSAEAGLPTAQYYLTKMLLEGEGCDVDIPKAAMYARWSKNGGDPDGTRLFARMLANGQGMQANRAESIRLLEEQWKKAPDAKTAELLGELNSLTQPGEKQDIDQAQHWFKNAIAQGSETAKAGLGLVEFQKAYPALENLDLAGKNVKFSMQAGTLESVDDKTHVVGSTSTSNTFGTMYNAGDVGFANATTTTNTTVQRQHDVQLNIRTEQGKLLSITMTANMAIKAGLAIGHQVSIIYAELADSASRAPVTIRSRTTGGFGLVGTGIPAEVQAAINTGTGSAVQWGFAAFACLLLTGASASSGTWLILGFFSGMIWCGVRMLKVIRADMKAKKLDKKYLAHVVQILDLESRLVLTPA